MNHEIEAPQINNQNNQRNENDEVSSTLEEGEELSFEDEQLQGILMNHMKEMKIIEERELKQKQDKEYNESLLIDKNKKDLTFEEVSVEEMRRIRLLRFEKFD
jgi:hypothetical protein